MKTVKFTQIMSAEGNKLYALDTEGQVWVLDSYRGQGWAKIAQPQV